MPANPNKKPDYTKNPLYTGNWMVFFQGVVMAEAPTPEAAATTVMNCLDFVDSKGDLSLCDPMSGVMRVEWACGDDCEMEKCGHGDRSEARIGPSGDPRTHAEPYVTPKDAAVRRITEALRIAGYPIRAGFRVKRIIVEEDI